ncbi:unnamed protein product [Lepeophtheirus salmonis]|uniref:(salmon louse) hypothetical protein n=1 Tax=Lepeophtheirus salmonis TaxID=72036 RepID=A0A0K2T7P2_LEPSM|nr:UPF0547 protein C16orf87-like [Lepeophtheirus salmonis]CAB4066973.1 unnamed protein product [Lepeophtheirus salmonis]CAF2980072.1 unnamed protein product [Lepeophtheirus salmonis]
MPKSRSSNSSGGTPSSGASKLCEECGASTSSRNHHCGGVDSPESVDSDHQNERRRSERVKREKPDYYDASEFEKKTRKQRVKSTKQGSPKKTHHRATLTWKKTGDEEVDEKDKKKRKRSRQRDSELSEELPPEKTLQCKVGLAEINRKLGGVMCQPGF